MLAPNAEIAAAIVERLEAQLATSGRRVWPTPQIRDFSSWTRQQYERQHFSNSSAPRLLSDVEERQLWREVIAASAIAAEFSDAAGAARAARRARRALREYRIPTPALAAHHGAEADALAQWLQEFQDRCGELNALAADDILTTLAAPELAPRWIESPGWHPLALNWLRSHAGEPLPPCALPGAAAGAVHVYRSPAAELAACAEWARRNRESNPGFRAWIHIPDLATRRAQIETAFDSALAPGRFDTVEYLAMPPYAIAGGTPLADHEPVRIALAVLRAVCEELSFTRFSALLRAQQLQGSPADAADAARLDEALRSRAPSAATLSTWLSLSRRVAALRSLTTLSALDRLQRIEELFASERSRLMLSSWVPRWTAALDAGPWVERASWSSAAYQAAERFRELHASLACADQIYGPLSVRAAIGALSSAARETLFQAQTGVPPLWITGGRAQDPWLAYDGIWICGASADEWPPAAAALPLIPVQVQREFGVAGSTAALQMQAAIDLQRRWTARAAGIVFSCASGAGLPAVPSTLLPPDIVPGETAATDPLLQRIRGAGAGLERYVDTLGPAFAADEKTRGTASLRDQSMCAFRGFALTRLRADRLELPEPGFNTMERGTLLHAALESIWRRIKGSEQLARIDPAELSGLIDSGVDSAIATAVARRNPGARWSEREGRRLKRLLPQWFAVEAARAGFDVQELEVEMRGVRFGGLAFDVRIDRIDRLRDGGLVLIDYKSGDVKADWRGERPDNPQLPVYALSVTAPIAAVAYAQVQARDCRFLGLAANDQFLPGVGARYAETGGDMRAEAALWSIRIERLAEALKRGAAAVAPTPSACRNCHLQGLCRIASDGESADAD